MRHKKLLPVLFLISLVGYGSSFFMESFIAHHSDEQSNPHGYTAFYYGLLFVFHELRTIRYGFHSSMLISLIWLANVAYWIAVFMFVLGECRGALVVSECGVFLACPLLGLWIWGAADPRLSYGFFVWIGSIVLLAVASRLRLYFGNSVISRPNVPIREPAVV
jgi:hypothetical protein